MLQIKTFSLPADEQAANEFLAAHKPDNITHHEGLMILAFDDGEYNAAYRISDQIELLRGAQAAKEQQLFARAVLEKERDAIATAATKISGKQRHPKSNPSTTQ